MDIYLDTAPVIYLVENVVPWEPAVRAILERHQARPRVSELTRLECRVQPMRDGNTALLKDFEDFFASIPGGLLSLGARFRESD